MIGDDNYKYDNKDNNENKNIDKNDYKPELLTLSEKEMFLLTNGIVRQCFNQLKRFNVTTNDISKVIFKYFENDYNRYWQIRYEVSWAISNATVSMDCTITFKIDSLFDQFENVVALLTNLLEYEYSMEHDTNPKRCTKLLTVVLEALNNLFNAGSRVQNVNALITSTETLNTFAIQMEQAGCVDQVCFLLSRNMFNNEFFNTIVLHRIQYNFNILHNCYSCGKLLQMIK